MRIGIKYCGGCRASFDRKLEAEQTAKMVLEAGSAGRGISFEPAADGEYYDILLAVCGCRTLCADISPYKANETVYIGEAGDAAKAAKDLVSRIKRI